VLLRQEEKDRPKGFLVKAFLIGEGFLYNGTFAREEMPRSLHHSDRCFLALALTLLFCVTSVAQSSAPTPSISLPGSQSPYTGSEPEGKATSEVLQLGLQDAIDRGLRNNLGLLLSGDQTIMARGERWKELSELLPHVSGRVQEDVENESLAALGFQKLFPLLIPKGSIPGAVPAVTPAFNYFDARATVTQSLFNFSNLEKERSASESLKSAQYSFKDARELVVLAVGNAYLLAIASAARIETTQAQVTNSQALYDKAKDQLKAGLSPAIDTLRSQVELQTRQQQLIASRNDFAKQKLSLARVIGLPPGQEFLLIDKSPYQALTAMPLEIYLQRAYTTRSDYQAAQAQVRAAELLRRSATAEHYPSLDMNANYGDIGVTPAHSNGTWQVNGGVTIPIFAGGKTHSDVLEAEAQLKQARSQLADLRGRIDYEVRASLLDLSSAADQVAVARSNVELAEQTLTQSEDRFSAGVADNLEVVQAQESVASAHENYIQALYAHNLSKIELARSIGDAEQGVKRVLKGEEH
jgi:outer membrane protein TolC